ncbi:MAG: hypothetical protein ACR2MP_06135, partial [Streptosporangiaceae bacterium]
SWRREPGQLDGVAGTGVVDPGWLSELLAGTRGARRDHRGLPGYLQVSTEMLGAPADTGGALIT